MNRYSILFDIALLHDYYSNRKCKDFEIVPSTDCMAIFKNMHIQGRYTENRYSAFIEENNQHEPALNIPAAKYRSHYGKTVFRLYLKLKNPLFLNYTNIDAAYSSRKKFYFSNGAKNKDNGVLYLSAPVSQFTNQKQYVPGNLVKDALTGKVYEALKKHTSKKKSELSDSALWAPKGLLNLGAPVHDHTIGKFYMHGDLVKQAGTDNVFEAVQKHTSTKDSDLNNHSLWVARGQGQLQYVTDNDIIEYSGSNYIFKLSSPVKKAEIAIFGFNYSATAPAYDMPVRESDIKTFDKSTAAVPVNLALLQPGKYAIKVNDETTFIYYDPAVNFNNIYGVIEIFNYLPGKDDYALLTNDEKIKSVNYQLFFPARRVLWKFIRKDSKAQAITDTGSTGYQFSLTGDEFVSSTPIPLSESVLKTLSLEFGTADFKLFPLPNPPIQQLGKCTQNEYDYLCSELNLNY